MERCRYSIKDNNLLLIISFMCLKGTYSFSRCNIYFITFVASTMLSIMLYIIGTRINLLFFYLIFILRAFARLEETVSAHASKMRNIGRESSFDN